MSPKTQSANGQSANENGVNGGVNGGPSSPHNAVGPSPPSTTPPPQVVTNPAPPHEASIPPHSPQGVDNSGSILKERVYMPPSRRLGTLTRRLSNVNLGDSASQPHFPHHTVEFSFSYQNPQNPQNVGSIFRCPAVPEGPR